MGSASAAPVIDQGAVPACRGRGIGPVVVASSDATWAKAGLPPGRYRLTLEGRRDASGNLHRLVSDNYEEFDLKPGETVELHVVLHSDREAARIMFMPPLLLDVTN